MRYIAITLAFLCSLGLFAIHEEYVDDNSFLEGSEIEMGQRIFAEDQQYETMDNDPASSWGFFNHRSRGYVSLEVNLSSAEYSSAFTARIRVQLDYEKYEGSGFTLYTDTTWLIVRYDPDAGSLDRNKDVFVIEGAQHIYATILAVEDEFGANKSTLLPEKVKFSVDGYTERYYDHDPNYIVDIKPAETEYQENQRVFKIVWENTKAGVEGFDLEWTYVDNVDMDGTLPASQVNYDFEENSTRIQLTGDRAENPKSFKIPAIYEQGYLLYRIRPFWYQFTSRGKEVMPGKWNDCGDGTGLVSSCTQKFLIEGDTIQEEDLNWQYTVSFAEEGKHKVVMRYFDGSLRERQAVTNLNTEDLALVQEKIYDHQGRPAVNILPAPASGNQSAIHYYQNFNLSANSNEFYSKLDFDTTAGLCGDTIAPLASDSGAGLYYSGISPLRDTTGIEGFVPDADGYPFTVTEYTADNTGRIRRQSGVGKHHKLGSRHDTEYIYSTPGQRELDRLFGTEVGFAKHYRKIMSIDPNGQVSVRYENLAGKTIATGLAGESPANLKKLPANEGVKNEVEKILPDGKVSQLVISYPVEVSSAGTYKFLYEMTPKVFEDACIASTDLCMECVYRLQISVLDECGTEVLTKGKVDTMIGTANGLCDEPLTMLVDSTRMETTVLPIGIYTVNKILTLNEAVIDTYFNMYLDSSTCLVTYQEFYEEAMDSLEVDLNEGLDTCLQCPGNDYCSRKFQMLKADFMPGGQYALYDTTYDASDYDLSILNSNNNLPNGDAAWNYSSITYTDHQGNPDSIEYDGKLVIPQDLPLKDYINQFRPYWADSLVQFHPEYCYFEWCIENKHVPNFRDAMLSANSFSEAYEKGLLNPIDVAQVPGAVPDTLLSPYVNAPDSFYVNLGQNDSLRDSLFNGFHNFVDNYNIWEIALMITVCPQASGTTLDTCLINHEFGKESCYNDRLWFTFRALYLSERWKAVEIDRIGYAIDNGCYNGCIDVSEFNSSSDQYYNDVSGDPDQTCNSGNYAFYEEKDRRFPDMAFAASHLDGNWEDTTEAKAKADSTMAAQCDSACIGYAQHWMEQLSECDQFIGAQSWAPGNTIYDKVRDSLIAVCAHGCDYTDLFGTSTAPGKGGYQSFQDVLEGELTNYGLTPGCSQDAINFPKPKGHSYMKGENNLPILDTCSCKEIVFQKDSFDIKKANSTLPEGVSSFTEYISHELGIGIPLAQEALCTCEEAYEVGSDSWNSVATSYLKNNPFSIPDLLTCDQCINCDTLQYYFDKYVQVYEGQDSFLQEYLSELSVITNFLNRKLGFNLTSPEYLEHYEECNPYSGELDTVILDEFLTPKALDLYDILLYYQNNQLFGDTTIQIGYISEFYNSSLNTTASDTGCWKATMQLIPVDSLLLPSCLALDSSNHNHRVLWTIEDTCSSVNYQFNIQPTSEAYAGTFYDGLNYTFDEFDTLQPTYCGEISRCPLKYFQLSHNRMTAIVKSYDIPIQTCALIPAQNICNNPLFTTDSVDPDLEEKSLIALAEYNANYSYNKYIDSLKTNFRTRYRNLCSNIDETMYQSSAEAEYHYTLYYYDIAGNLMKTVPPEGVHEFPADTVDMLVAYHDSLRTGGTLPFTHLEPNHRLASTYEFKTFNKVFDLRTPDGGDLLIFYDGKGRPVSSQNDKQEANKAHSFTNYDALGRVVRTGETYWYETEAPLEQDVYVYNHPTYPEVISWMQNFDTIIEVHQVTKTIYDTAIALDDVSGQEYLRGRVSSVLFRYDGDIPDEDIAGGEFDYDYASHYSYDPHGNVKKLWQDLHKVELAPGASRARTIEYDYDLVSGNVNAVSYQRGYADQFYHAYTYDADNRITEVRTSHDSLIWDRDATYKYYRHGPLARVELGEHMVQGVDHAYTLQGWLKGVNSNRLQPQYDIGGDGADGSPYQHFAHDAFGFSLSYFEGDYQPINNRDQIGPGSYFLMKTAGSAFGNASDSLWNGNIRHMVTTLMDTDNNLLNPQGTAYRYDQLNRLVGMKVHEHTGGGNEWAASGTAIDHYRIDSITYDANGNIESLARNGNLGAGNEPMDRLTYAYKPGTNQLTSVSDEVPAPRYDNDIDSQEGDNYDYDEIGNLTADAQGEIENIEWTVRGKIKKITRTEESTKAQLEFDYGPMGNRIMKRVTPYESEPVTTYYIRDAQGNLMATYQVKPVEEEGDWLFLKDKYLYGSERLGSYATDSIVTTYTADDDSNRYERIVGNKQFELSNHLGNVLATVTDQKIAVDNNGQVGYFLPKVVSYSSYYPFGMKQPGMHGSLVDYKHGFNGKWMDDEVYGEGNIYDYGFRIYDPRIGKFLSVDPLTRQYPYLSPYGYAHNNPIRFIDLDGKEGTPPKYEFNKYGGTVVSWDGNVWYFKYSSESNTGGWQYTYSESTGWVVHSPKSKYLPMASISATPLYDYRFADKFSGFNGGKDGKYSAKIKQVLIRGAIDIGMQLLDLPSVPTSEQDQSGDPALPEVSPIKYNVEKHYDIFAYDQMVRLFNTSNNTSLSKYNTKVRKTNVELKAAEANVISVFLLTESQYQNYSEGGLSLNELSKYQYGNPENLNGLKDQNPDADYAIYYRRGGDGEGLPSGVLKEFEIEN